MPIHRIGVAIFAPRLIHQGANRHGYTGGAPNTAGYSGGIEASRVAQPNAASPASRAGSLHYPDAWMLDVGLPPSAWTATRTLNVDTGGAIPVSILPDPEGSAIPLPGDFLLAWSAIVDHVLTPTTGATLRLQVQLDTSEEFSGPETATSARVLGSQQASVNVGVTSPGVYWVRLRTLADYGNDSAWATYQITVTVVTPFVRDPQWRAQTGPRPNRVFVRIAGSATIKTAEVGGVPASAKVDHWVEVPSGTSEAEAQNTANAILAVLQGRPVSVSGSVALTVAAGFDRLVIAQWWEINPAGERVKREEHAGLVLAKKVHDIDASTTELHLGDYAPPPEETLARILAKLSRR